MTAQFTKRMGATIYPPANDTSVGSHELPSDFVVKARRRLMSISTVFMTLSLISWVVLLPLGMTYDHVASAVGTVVWTTVAVATRMNRISDMTALHVGLVGLVLYTVMTSTWLPRQLFLVSGRYPEATWTLVLITAFPLIVPVSPRRLVAALAVTTLTIPLGYVFNAYSTELVFSWRELIKLYITGIYTAIISYFGARWIYRLGVDMARERELGAYRLQSQLGAGGMGEVWLASHRLLARPAAIKLVRPEYLSKVSPPPTAGCATASSRGSGRSPSA